MKWFAIAALLVSVPGAALALDRATAPAGPATQRLLELTRVADGFDCRNVSCKQLSSCEEACYKLVVCGQSIRDRDKDGIPCESLCSRPCPR